MRKSEELPIVTHSASNLTDYSALIYDAQMTLPKWQEVGRSLALVARTVPWVIGDWLNHGREFLDRSMPSGVYANAAEITGLSTQTLKDYAWLARKFPRPRDPNFSITHARELTHLSTEECSHWVNRISNEGLPVRALRAQIREGEKIFLTEPGDFPKPSILKQANLLAIAFASERRSPRFGDKTQDELLGTLKEIIDWAEQKRAQKQPKRCNNL